MLRENLRCQIFSDLKVLILINISLVSYASNSSVSCISYQNLRSIKSQPFASLLRYIFSTFPSTAVSLRDARISLNFGEKPFVHSPDQLSGGRVKWQAPIEVPADKVVQNVNSGWRINQFDTTSTLNLIVSEDGRMVQATDNEWQGFRANKVIQPHRISLSAQGRHLNYKQRFYRLLGVSKVI